MTDYKNFIAIKKGVLGGKPVIKGTRIPLATIVDEIAGGVEIQEIMKEYDLAEEQVRAALQYAAASLREEVAFA